MVKLQYDIDKKKFSELRDIIEVPKFQRGLVWNKTKKIEFIKTLKSGLPIGVLLVSKKNDKYLVIDGLQRFTTMKDYSNDYFSYISDDEITDTDVMGIILSSEIASGYYDKYSDVDKTKVKDDIRIIIKNKISTGNGKNNFEISDEIVNDLCKNVSIFGADPSAKTTAMGTVFKIVDEFSKNATIDDIPIPLIIFTGSDDDLATIFQKLNQEGVKLSKYDVFAATWVNHMVTVKNDPDFIDIVIKKYKDAQEQSGLEISNYDPDFLKESGQLTVFEYSYAVGKAMIDKCNVLFPKNDKSKVDSIGFLILAEIMGLQYSQMGMLADALVKNKHLDLKKLKNAIVETTYQVERALMPYIVAPTSKTTSLVCHSDLQLASYIIVLFKLKYYIDNEGLHERTGTNKSIKDMKLFMYKHYLFDILKGYWSGSGDSKLEDILVDVDTCKYLKDVNKQSFEQAINEWITASNDKASLTNVSAESKLFLNYLLRTNNHIGKEEYDIEHCVPKKIVKNFIINKEKDVPMSAISNMVYIPLGDNRWKGEYTYYQKQKKDAGAFNLDENALDKYAYPSHAELEFVESTETISAENYRSFLKNREMSISNRLLKGLYE